MKGRIDNFCGGLRTRNKGRHLIVKPESISDKNSAASLVGKAVVWKNPEGKQRKEIKGVVRATHGSRGSVRVVFERGLPGQALGTEVEIVD
ncbi:MAG: 50S ribosomal protein L35ae [Candidatus Woesearchaeota archaeon]